MRLGKIADIDAFDTVDPSQLNKVYDYLLNSELFSLYREAFERLSGHTIALIHRDVVKTPSQEVERCNNSYCTTLLESGSCTDRCLEHIVKLSKNALVQSSSGTCEGQITTSLIPVKVKKDVIAFIKAGQIKLEEKSLSDNLLSKLADSLPDSVAEYLHNAFDSMPSVSKESYTDQLMIIGAFSMQLSDIAEKILKGSQSDSLITERCKSYISEHLTEKICLDEMAEVTGVTNSYMCKQFKKYTGMTIVEYINVHRVEMAKEQLEEGDDKKVIDIAYACGFQSLSQFNRTFQKFAGCTPTEFKKQVARVYLYNHGRHAKTQKIRSLYGG